MSTFHVVLQKLHDPWIIVGFVGQGLFMMRFIVQWIHSERSKRSVIPTAFWTFSISGGAVLLIYALYDGSPVFIAGQGLGLIVYFRNLVLVRRSAQRANLETPASQAYRLAEQLQKQIHDLDDLALRPTLVDETVEQIRTLLNNAPLSEEAAISIIGAHP